MSRITKNKRRRKVLKRNILVIQMIRIIIIIIIKLGLKLTITITTTTKEIKKNIHLKRICRNTNMRCRFKRIDEHG